MYVKIRTDATVLTGTGHEILVDIYQFSLTAYFTVSLFSASSLNGGFLFIWGVPKLSS